MGWQFHSVADSFEFTEGPVWDGDRIIFTDIPNARIHTFDPESETCTTLVENSGGANGLKLSRDGSLVACELMGRCVSKYNQHGRSIVVNDYRGVPLNSPNDLAIDDADTIWFTDPPYEVNWAEISFQMDHGYVYCYDQTLGQIDRMTTDTVKPNGILVAPGGDEVYIAETNYESYGCQELRSYRVTNDDELGDYRVLHDFAPHRGIDGMCLDEDGNIIATAGWKRSGPGPMLYEINPSHGVHNKHEFPGAAPTNCAFGGPELRTLYVTTQDGGLYRTETERKGHLKPPDRLQYRQKLG